MFNVGTLLAVLRLDNQMSRALRVVNKDLRSLGSIAGQAGKLVAAGIGVAVAAITGIGAAALKAASDFESSFAGVRKTVDATESEFASLSAGFRRMAQEIPVNVNELNKIGEAAGQLGIKTENILGFTETMAKLGVTTNLSADQAATALARLANITGLPQTEFDRLGSTIVALGNTFATTEAEIVEFGVRMAGAGTIAGLTEPEILAIGAAMSSVGVEAEAGGTAVQKVLLGITQAVSTGSEDLAVFAQTAGLSAQEFADLWERDAAAAFSAFVEGLGSQGDKAFVTLEKLDLQDQRLIRSFLSLAGAGDLLSTAMAEGNTAFAENNALSKEAEQRFATLKSQWDLVKNSVNEVFIQIGQMLLPVFKDMVENVRGFITREGPAIAETIGVVFVEAIGFAIKAIGFLGKAYNKVKEITNEVGKEITRVSLELKRQRREQLQAQIAALGKYIERTGASAETTRRYGMTLGEMRAELQGVELQVEQAAGTLVGFREGADEAREATDGVNQFLEKVQGTAARYRAMIEGAAAANREMADSADDLAGAQETAEETIQRFLDEMPRLQTDVGDATKFLRDNEDQLMGTADALSDYAVRVREADDNTVRWGDALVGVFDVIRTGKQWLDNLIGSVVNFIGKLIGGGSLTDALGSAASGISGLIGSVGGRAGGILGNVAGAILPGGPLAGLFGGGGAAAAATTAGTTTGTAMGAGMLAGIKTSLAGAASSIGGAFSSLGATLAPLFTNPFTAIVGGAIGVGFLVKKLFGGPSAAEKEARKVADSFDPIFKALLTTKQLTETGGEVWKANNIAQRDIIIALGGSVEDVQEIWARFQDRAKDPESAKAFADFWTDKLEAVQKKMDETGLTLLELKKQAKRAARDASKDVADATLNLTKNITAEYKAMFNSIRDDSSLSAEQQEKQLQELETWYANALEGIEKSSKGVTERVVADIGRASKAFRDMRFIPGGDSGVFFPDGRPTFVGQTSPGQVRVIPGPPNQPVHTIAHGGEFIGRVAPTRSDDRIVERLDRLEQTMMTVFVTATEKAARHGAQTAGRRG